MLKKSDVTCLGFILPFIVISIIFPLALAEAKWSLTPRMYVEEQYDDNIFLTERNEQDDVIITVSPGVNLNYQAPTGEIDLDYEFRRSFHSDFSDLDFSGHYGRAEARKDLASWVGVGIREIFIRSEDPIELTGVTEFEKPSIRQGRRDRYTRNVVEPQATFRFGENRSIRIGYRNMILRNDRDDIADQDENAGNALLTFRFNIRNGIEIFYEHINMEYDDTIPPTADEDFDRDEIRGKYTYYFDPRTSAFLEYVYLHRDFDRESARFFDYEVHVPSLGLSRDLYENVNLTAGGGYAFRNADRPGNDEDAFFGRVDLAVAYKRLLLNLYGETGVGEDFYTAESLGFNEFWRVGLHASYQLLETLKVAAFFYIQEEDFSDRDREDTTWSARGTLDYQLLRWLLFGFEYEHNERDSNVPFQSYDNNRYLGRLTVQYDITEFF
jgi:predicted porin